MVELLELDISVSFANLYLQIHLVFKNYNAINILQIVKSSYFWFKKNSHFKHANDTFSIYTYFAM